MPDDHSEVVPLLPIPNRTVKRVSADDSADSRVKVGHRQAITARKRPLDRGGVFFGRMEMGFDYVYARRHKRSSRKHKSLGVLKSMPIHVRSRFAIVSRN